MVAKKRNVDGKMKKVCCYHLEDFGRLNETQQHTLFDHHFKSIFGPIEIMTPAIDRKKQEKDCDT